MELYGCHPDANPGRFESLGTQETFRVVVEVQSDTQAEKKRQEQETQSQLSAEQRRDQRISELKQHIFELEDPHSLECAGGGPAPLANALRNQSAHLNRPPQCMSTIPSSPTSTFSRFERFVVIFNVFD